MISLPSLKALFVEIRFNEVILATGTAFSVLTANGPMLVTARHNVTGRRQDNNEPLDQKNAAIPNNINVRHFYIDDAANHIFYYVCYKLYEDNDLHHGQKLWHEHPQLGSVADIVALETESVAAGADYSFSLYPQTFNGLSIGVADAHFIPPSQMVSVVGYPYSRRAPGELAVWVQGSIASETSLHNEPTFWIDCRSRKGQSGSPVISHSNTGTIGAMGGTIRMDEPITQLHGIYSGRISDESDIGVVWKTSAIRELCQSIQSR